MITSESIAILTCSTHNTTSLILILGVALIAATLITQFVICVVLKPFLVFKCDITQQLLILKMATFQQGLLIVYQLNLACFATQVLIWSSINN